MKVRHSGVPIYRNEPSQNATPNTCEKPAAISTTIVHSNKAKNQNQTDITVPTTSQQPHPTRLTSMSEFVTTSKAISIRKSKENDLQLVRMIVKHYHPLKLVEEEEFKKFVKLLGPFK
ncbi:hypothetical protein QE152_g25259 [Popillia japonica]|uniref:Uncharacterized protein n=1 Tax=Popillia japonica TaxID=7064 RepID=A0AAW1K1R9_POPJA